LNGLITCDVDLITSERGAWGLLLNKRGKVVCDMTLLGDADGLWLGTLFGLEELFELLDGYLVMEDAELSKEPDLTWLTLHGSGAVKLAEQAAPSSARRQAAVPWTQTEGAALVLPRADVDACLEHLVAAGAQRADDSVWRSLRVQMGLPEFGVDFTPDDNPHEASLERRVVSFSKGCYMGQEVVCMQDMRGKVKRRLARVSGASDTPFVAGAIVSDSAGGNVGSITTPGQAPYAGEFSAIAKLKAPHYEAGSRLRVGQVPVIVHSLGPDAAGTN
jgi:folate-binding protein YgfZ